jgi:hypothetical protein
MGTRIMPAHFLRSWSRFLPGFTLAGLLSCSDADPVSSDNSSLSAAVAAAGPASSEVVFDEPTSIPGQPGPVEFASDGTNFLGVWVDRRIYGNIGATDQVMAVRIGPNGRAIDPSPIIVASVSFDSLKDAKVVYDGSNYVVAWEGQELRAARVSSAGSVIDTTSLLIGSGSYQFGLARGTNQTLIVFTSASGLMENRLPPSGAPLDGTGFSLGVANSFSRVAAASDGSQYLIVWEDIRNSQSIGTDLYGARIKGSDATVLDPGGFPVAVTFGEQTKPVVAFDGTQFFAAWTDGRRSSDTDVLATGISVGGKVLNTDPIVLAGQTTSEQLLGLAWSGTQYLATWSELGKTTQVAGGFNAAGDGQGTTSINFATGNLAYGNSWFMTGNGTVAGRISPTLQTPDPNGVSVSYAANSESEVSVARGPGQWAGVWSESRDGNTDVVAGRLSDQLTELDPGGVVLDVGGGTPAIASNGAEYLAVWNRAGGIYATRLLPNGGVGTPGGALIGSSGSLPALASNGKSYLVVYVDGSNIMSRVFDPCPGDGTWTTPVQVTTISSSAPLAGVAWDGKVYNVVFASLGSVDTDLFGARVGADGTLIDSVRFPISTAVNYQQRPRIACGVNNQCLVVWEDTRADLAGDIFGARIKNGATIDALGIPISILRYTSHATGTQELLPDVTWDGHDYLVAWQDNANRDSYDVNGVYVDSTGTLVGSSFPISALPVASEIGPRLSTDGAGHVLAGYTRYDDAQPFASNRARGRIVSSAQLGTQNPTWVNPAIATAVSCALPDGGVLYEAGVIIDASTSETGGGGVEAGEVDSGVVETGPSDAGAGDSSSSSDGTASDASGGPKDATSATDAAAQPQDAGTSTGSLLDARQLVDQVSFPADASQSEASTEHDASAPEGSTPDSSTSAADGSTETPPGDSGCSCTVMGERRTAPFPPGSFVVALALTGLAGRRWKRRAVHSTARTTESSSGLTEKPLAPLVSHRSAKEDVARARPAASRCPR